jgi:hypothetical protein
MCVLELPVDVPGAQVVEIALGFAAIPIPPLHPGLMSHHDMRLQIAHLERSLADITGSASWRLTEPLRAAKRRSGRP